MSKTNKNPTNSSHIPRAGATLLGPPQPARDRERDDAQHEPVLPPDPPLPRTGPTRGPGQGASQTRGTHGRADDHGNDIEQLSRVLPSKARIKGYVRRWDRRAPPPAKLNAWDAWTDSAHVTCENGAKENIPRRRLTASRSVRGASTLASIPFLRTPIWGTQGTKGSPHGTREAAGYCQRARVCYAGSSLPHRTERPDTRARAEPP